jgi:long-chain acyl-CoA synthetase
MNISTLLNDNIMRFGEFESVNFDGKWRTNLQTHQDASRLGYLLRDLGIEKGDRVVVQLLNCPEVLISFPAINRIGAVIVPLSPLLGPEQATHILRDCEAKIVITSSHFLERVRKVKEKAPDLKHIILIDRDDVPDTIPYQKKVQEYSTELEAVQTDNDDLATLLYTAGTTGKPKGVMHTHFSLYVNTLFLYEFSLVNRPKTITQTVTEIDPKTYQPVKTEITVTGLERSIVSLGVLPLSHAYGIALMYLGALTGSKSIVHPWFDATKALEAIQTYKVNYMALVPTMYIHLLNHPDLDNYDLSSLVGCSCGSAPLPLKVAHKWEEKVGVEIREGWGMSETGATTCGQPPKQPPKYGSIGKSYFKCNTVTIFNEQDQETAH